MKSGEPRTGLSSVQKSVHFFIAFFDSRGTGLPGGHASSISISIVLLCSSVEH